MPDDKRNDSPGLKAFLQEAIPLVEQQRLDYPVNGPSRDYQFLLIATMYRETLKAASAFIKPKKNGDGSQRSIAQTGWRFAPSAGIEAYNINVVVSKPISWASVYPDNETL